MTKIDPNAFTTKFDEIVCPCGSMQVQRSHDPDLSAYADDDGVVGVCALCGLPIQPELLEQARSHYMTLKHVVTSARQGGASARNWFRWRCWRVAWSSYRVARITDDDTTRTWVHVVSGLYVAINGYRPAG